MKYRKTNIRSIGDYQNLFAPSAKKPSLPMDREKVKDALEKALDIRKFEIEMYWKRATYFWAFIAAAFAGYFALLASKDILQSDKPIALLMVACIGLTFSLGWFLANKGSKFWQVNWERQVDMLENFAYGPLYKTTLDNTNLKPFHPTTAYQFSVSKVNQLLSLYITFVWVVLCSSQILTFTCWHDASTLVAVIGIPVITLAAIYGLCRHARSDDDKTQFFFETREVVDN
jgi:hypothetical protein